MSYNSIILSGPTAVGKTEISIVLAKLLDAEIISADSTQIYKELDIATAKITESEKENIKHHFIDFLKIGQEYSVGDFQRDSDILLNKNKKYIIVGGTGLYTDVLNEGLSPMPKSNKILRESLEKKDLNELLLDLENKNKKVYDKIDKNNKRRVVRALELITLNDTENIYTKKVKNHNQKFLNVYLTRNRDQLYERINLRVDKMIENGLLEEGKKIYNKYRKYMTEIKAIGYRQMYDYFEGNIDYQTMIDKIKQHSRNYAKRQITWFKKKNYLEINLSNISLDKAVDIIIKEFKRGSL